MAKRSLPVIEPWYAAGLSFTCTQCGNCCTGGPGYVWISNDEVERLAEHIGLTRQQVVRRYCREVDGKLSIRERRDERGQYPCIFLIEQEGRQTCGIYPVRPLQCRTWPFWDGNLATPRSWEHAGRKCPGIDQGKAYTRGQIESLRDATDWPTAPPGRNGFP